MTSRAKRRRVKS
uniref:Uncharacterized protein n=1 Tax=Rhizophora mucronata TaxID=61149 RepID=A0A2P2J0J1_RHIMU